MRVDLIALGGAGTNPSWTMGRSSACAAEPDALGREIERLLGEPAPDGQDGPSDPPDAVLLWSAGLGEPDPEIVARLLAQPDDVWHGGLRLGTGGLPRAVDSVAPTWMLNRDPDSTIEATSWRVDLRACLVRCDVLRSLGGPDKRFESLAAAGLDLGHRWVSHGARVRHVPSLVPDDAPTVPPVLGLADELRFVESRYGRKWMGWAAAHEARHPLAALRAVRSVLADPNDRADADLVPPEPTGPTSGSVTVLVPTVERYPFLRVVLGQLRTQTVAPHQIVVVDQTPPDEVESALFDEFSDLPLEVIMLQPPGQCSARNAGLSVATGDFVLFIDDDDEIPNDLIESHLRSITSRRVEVSSGVVHEAHGPPLSAEFRRFRVSDTFPTNNTLVRRSALDSSGWFDLAYDRGDRADHDLGMRLYLSGARMVMDPHIDLLHHHAPRGGLRVHNARAVTYGGSRRSITVRQTLSPTQIYLWRRYYSTEQVRKAVRLHLAAGLFGTGSRSRRLARLAVQALSLPAARRETSRAEALATDLLVDNPRIPGPEGRTNSAGVA